MEDLSWFKSSHSGTNNGECVEAAFTGDGAAVRDSKDPEGGSFRLPAQGWQAFLEAVGGGSFHAS
ncbi:DUF397 domain-containing protein [Amycolatopsis sp. NPDC051373]|uniref:DUF397 domain-containing protein n=1 Tax=Amycolatopsis sp. NPDC051373 TaxID=3155801 RepID=UPI00344CCADE